MTSADNMRCPICKNVKPIDGIPGISCSKCKFEYAFVRWMAGDRSRKLYQEKMQIAKYKYILSQIEHHSEKSYFTLTGNSVAYVSDKENTLYIINGDRSIEKISDVMQYSASERNSAILYRNGKLSVYGDDSYGQCDIQGLKDIAFVMCAPNCVYTVNKMGEVFVVGAVVDENIKKWKNMKSLVCGSYHVLGLTKDNTVKIGGYILDQNMIDIVSKWKNVKSIAAATDCSVALFQDGTVAFAGRKDDPRNNIDLWENIEAVSVDSSYVIGIKKGGDIMMAGSCKAFLDMGRSSAKDWKNVIAVTCSRSGIAAILSDGTIRIAGNISGNVDEICEAWDDHIEI